MPELRLATLAVDRIKRFSEEIEEQEHIISFDSQDNKEELATTGSPYSIYKQLRRTRRLPPPNTKSYRMLSPVTGRF
jgi:hypothetical protein